MSTKVRVLVVANRTVDSSELIAALRQRAARSPVGFTLLVPAVPRGLSWAVDMKAGGPEAELRARTGALHMRSCGLEIEAAMVGDPDPLAAVGDALISNRFDEVVVATLPHGVSHWLRLSLPQRVQRLTELPVVHVTAHPRHVRRGSRPRELAGVPS